MDTFQAIVLGVVQGLTEFLPISSTAHLRLVPALLGWEDPGAAFSAVIQLGTLAAVFLYFSRDIKTILTNWTRDLFACNPLRTHESRLGWMIILGSVPIGVCGLLFKDEIKTSLRSLWVVGLALIGLAMLLALAELIGKKSRSLESLCWKDALAIGLAQALALIPGSSRSGVTITAGLMIGLERAKAARFSFLLSIPAVLASGLYELYELIEEGAFASQTGGPFSLWAIGWGTLAALLSGYLSIAGLIRFLQSHSTWVFVFYRIALGAAVLIWVALGGVGSGL